jgi:hypothetical protein
MGGLDVFRFDDHVLDTERRELRRAADLAALNYQQGRLPPSRG